MPTLNQGQEYLGGKVLFDTATGKRLNPGDTTLTAPGDAPANAAANNGSGTPASSDSGFDFGTLSTMMQNEIGYMTSSLNTVDSISQKAITGTQAAADDNAKALESKYSRDHDYMLNDLTNQRTSIVEQGRGSAFSATALNAVDEKITKSLRDLDQRKNELILQGNSAAASKIADLQIKQIEFRQQAHQQVFANLLSMGNYGIQKKQLVMQQNAQNFQENQAVSQIALKYGIKLTPGMNLAQATAAAWSTASDEQKLDMRKKLADINLVNAQASKFAADAKNIDVKVKTDDLSIESYARAAMMNKDVLTTFAKFPDVYSKIVEKMSTITNTNVMSGALDDISSGLSESDALVNLQKNPLITDYSKASEIVKKVYHTEDIKKKLNDYNYDSSKGTIDTSTISFSNFAQYYNPVYVGNSLFEKLFGVK